MMDATPLLKLYARRRQRALARENPAQAQTRELRRLVAAAARTAFGRAHDFDNIYTVGDFQARVPLRSFEAFWEEWWRDPFPRLDDVTWPGLMPFFCVTSGTTTGRTKYIPCSREMIRSQVRGGTDTYVHHVTCRPASHVLGGVNFMLGGSTDLEELAPGIAAGDLSGIMAREMPWWASGRAYPPLELALMSDWEAKIERLADGALGQDVRAIGGVPSWMLILCDRLAARRPEAPRRLVEFFPNLELVIHGGVNFAPYRRRFAELLDGSRAETREVYVASEGFIATADRGDGEGMRLVLDNGLFYEFVPTEELDRPEPTRHWIADVETGVEYALVVSNCAGAWSYLLGDTVRLVERHPPRLLVTGRTSYMLSAFGEHLIDAEIEAAVSAAAAAIGAAVADFAVGPLFPEREGALGQHLYIVEFADAVPPPEALTRFAERLDQALAEDNDDYRAHRAGGFGMRAPAVHPVPPGIFAAWMKRRGQLGGQHKVPRIINDTDLFADLRSFVGAA